jgi:hypothetical protein
LDAQNQPRAIFHRFFADFGSVFRCFPSAFSLIFAGRWYEFGAESSAFVRAILALFWCLSLPKRQTKRTR